MKPGGISRISGVLKKSHQWLDQSLQFDEEQRSLNGFIAATIFCSNLPLSLTLTLDDEDTSSLIVSVGLRHLEVLKWQIIRSSNKQLGNCWRKTGRLVGTLVPMVCCLRLVANEFEWVHRTYLQKRAVFCFPFIIKVRYKARITSSSIDKPAVLLAK